jgi:hypothetical protein
MRAISETSMMKVSAFSNIDLHPFAKLERDVIPNRYQKKGGWMGRGYSLRRNGGFTRPIHEELAKQVNVYINAIPEVFFR